MDSSSGRGRKTKANTRGRCPKTVSGGNRCGRGLPVSRRVTRSQTRRRAGPSTMCSEETFDTQCSSVIDTSDTGSSDSADTYYSSTHRRLTTSRIRSSSTDLSAYSRTPSNLDVPEEIEFEYQDQEAQHCMVTDDQETEPLDTPIIRRSALRPSTEETPPVQRCPYGADLVSIFETAEMYVQRRDKYRPSFELDVFLRQTINDIGYESTSTAIGNELHSRTGADSIAVSVSEERHSAVAALRFESGETEESFQLEQLFAYDLIEDEQQLVSHSGPLPQLVIEDQHYQMKFEQRHNAFCSTGSGREISEVMTTEDPIAAAKIQANCQCLSHQLPQTPALEVQYNEFSEDYTLLSSSYGRVYNFLPTPKDFDEAIKQASTDDGGWEYSFNEKRASLHFLSALKQMEIEDLVYLLITSGLLRARNPRPGRIKRVYFNPR